MIEFHRRVAGDHRADGLCAVGLFEVDRSSEVERTVTTGQADGGIDVVHTLHGHLVIGAELDVELGGRLAGIVPGRGDDAVLGDDEDAIGIVGAADALQHGQHLGIVGRQLVQGFLLDVVVDQAEHGDGTHQIAVEGDRHQFETAALGIGLQQAQAFLFALVANLFASETTDQQGQDNRQRPGNFGAFDDEFGQRIHGATSMPAACMAALSFSSAASKS